MNFDVSAFDETDGYLVIACDYFSGDDFPIGTTIVTCDATDKSGNSAIAQTKNFIVKKLRHFSEAFLINTG